jgi:hypothetical protein
LGTAWLTTVGSRWFPFAKPGRPDRPKPPQQQVPLKRRAELTVLQ